ncbi:hypothetical protein GCM10011316_38790 [Roseibium aquae]|uniref:Uncharacterized protein n=1 Tax=Roseibium aquae TaxID=1323746 RepID=A0A916TQZ4_9HYPH|nr:hypothetical protein [Roseibium aquae]GGB63163.1 hypothetical protein GCM10011316_38790 [Roseibium aquae]
MNNDRQEIIKTLSQRVTIFAVFASATVFLIPSLLPESIGIPFMLGGILVSVPVFFYLLLQLVLAFFRR